MTWCAICTADIAGPGRVMAGYRVCESCFSDVPNGNMPERMQRGYEPPSEASLRSILTKPFRDAVSAAHARIVPKGVAQLDLKHPGGPRGDIIPDRATRRDFRVKVRRSAVREKT